MKYYQKFKVSGRGTFPFDMLRYDHCWPIDDTLAMDYDVRFNEDNAIRTVTLARHVELKSTEPTDGRWSSFGWPVVRGSVETRKI